MSQPSRPRTRGPAQRRSREHRIDRLESLEERFLLSAAAPFSEPFLATGPLTTTFTPAATPTNPFLGDVTINAPISTTYPGQEPVTTVNELTPTTSFGGDIVRIEAGPGGAFGNDVYAISRGAGDNTSFGAVNRPGVIYRVDPATGKASIFFDLNTVVNQLQPPTATAANSLGTATGLVNWYDLSFDPEGYFDGKPSLFVATVDRTNANLNVVYRIAPDGSFMGAFVPFTAGTPGERFLISPTSVLIPPAQDQEFLKGLFTGSGSNTPPATPTPFAALFFSATQYRPGTPIDSTTLPVGVSQTGLGLGPQVGLIASNQDYVSRVYSVFTDFGTPAFGTIPASPGLSGVQGLSTGELLISPPVTTTTNVTAVDSLPVATTPFRRFEDIAFDQYGYFSQGLPITTTTTGGVTSLGGIGSPVSAGNLFVADLATGLEVQVTPRTPFNTTPIEVPVQGPGPIGVTTDSSGNVIPIVSNGNTTDGSNLGGRILRILPDGTVTVFAEGFQTSGNQDSTSFINSSLSLSFSADGTTLYVSDDRGIWQFKTSADLADATSGTLIGLNDLRTLGVPYDGLSTAVAVVDTGVDANSAPFRGRVAPGNNIITGGFGNDDTSPSSGTTTTGTAAGTSANTVIQSGVDGHGTLIAGVVAQFVPQTTIDPVNIFNPFLTTTGTTATTTGTTSGLAFNSNASTNTSNVYKGIKYVADHPYVNDPIRPNQVDRLIAATYGFGSQTTFQSERAAYNQFPQLIIALKNQLKRYRSLGIAPIAAAGQFGNPLNDTSGAATTGAATTTTGAIGANNAGNNNVGDSNGISLPAILNEVISVTGVIPWPYVQTVSSLPTDVPIGVTPRPGQPILITAGSTATAGTTVGTGGSPLSTLLLGNTAATGGTGTTVTTTATGTFIGGIPQGLYADRVLAAANRSVTTDFAAPAADIPTFRRTFNLATITTTTGTTTTTTDPNDHLTFTEGGTSLSAGIVAGSFALVSSALNYWANMNTNGVTSDGYLTSPVGVNTLNFGPHAFKDLTAFNNPDGINAILAWTAVPVLDPNDGLSQSQPPYLFGTGEFRNFARVDVGNAIAAIEGTEAIQYLLDHNIFPIMDTNHDGTITAEELQTFENNATKLGLPEAGAMARLLGGTDSTPNAQVTSFNELPDQAGALQRRFNFFDYAADGQLNGSVTIAQFKMLAHTLLPLPDAYAIVDRQRASVNGFLVAPSVQRNFTALQHLLPKFEWVPKGALLKYRNITPDRFGINRLKRNVDLPGNQYPVWTLFTDQGVQSGVVSATSTKTTTKGTTAQGTRSATTATTGNTQADNGSTSTTTSTTPTGTGTSASTATTGTTVTSTSSSTSNNQSPQQTLAQAIASILSKPSGQ
jgi:hypothetical protein